jgi:opacity protein-like surface antigen
MPIKRLFAIVVLLVAVLTAGAAAQEEKNELTGIIGRTFIADQGVTGIPTFDPLLRSGNGLSFEVNYGRRLMTGDLGALTFEIPVVFNPDEDLHFSVNAVPKQYFSVFATPSLRANLFANSGVSPWVSFGVGFGHFSESSELEFGGTNPGETGSSTSVFQFGFGLDVRIRGRLSLRGQLRDFYSGVPDLNVNTGKDRQHNLFAGGGIVWRF